MCGRQEELKGHKSKATSPSLFLAIRRFKAMHCWAAEMHRTGRALNPGLFAGALVTTAVLRYSLDSMPTSATDDEVVDKPKELINLVKWETFWEQWCTYAGRLRGAAKCPLTYIFCEHEQVTNVMYAANYPDHDSSLIATMTFTGPWYEIDNHRIYDEFKALVLKGPGWSFVKTFDHAKDGRGAVLALKRQCEGTSAVQSRKAAAYARYNGQKRTFTFDNYVEVHQGAHNTLLDLDEPVPETKKVTDFLAGITDPRLSNAKDLILGDVQKLQNFEACQQYLKMLVYNKTTQEKHKRQVSGVHQRKVVGDRGPKSEKDQSSKTQASGVSARTYSKEEWSKLTDDERAKIKELQKAWNAANRGRDLSSGNRNASGIQQEGEQSDQSSGDSSSEDDADNGVVQQSSSEDGDYVPPTRCSGKSIRRN
jgi:hypothetical protein